jgi:SAM-dependent methyltransferase
MASGERFPAAELANLHTGDLSWVLRRASVSTGGRSTLTRIFPVAAMYTETAELYDLVYSSFKDYDVEAGHLAELLRVAHPDARTVLDVACGSAEHARRLAERHGYRVDGVDLDPRFVDIARERLPGGTVHQGDMRDFDLGRRYDVVTCLFSSIGYVGTLDGLRAAFATFRRHVTDGGVVLVEPWLTPEAAQPGPVHVVTAEGEEVTVVRMSLLEVEGRDSRLRFEYLVGREDGIQHLRETHALGLFTVEETLEAFAAAGLAADHDPQGLSGRGLYVARPAA